MKQVKLPNTYVHNRNGTFRHGHVDVLCTASVTGAYLTFHAWPKSLTGQLVLHFSGREHMLQFISELKAAAEQECGLDPIMQTLEASNGKEG